MALVCLMFWRRLHHRKESLKFKYRIYKLRDRLRREAINGSIDSKHWAFDHFDNSLSKAVANHNYITLLWILILDFKYSDTKEVMEFEGKLNQAKKEYPILRQIHKEYKEAVGDFIRNQHYVSINFFYKPILTPILGSIVLVSKFNTWLNRLITFPEISDFSSGARPT